jgi:hypothetical protein
MTVSFVYFFGGIPLERSTEKERYQIYLNKAKTLYTEINALRQVVRVEELVGGS